MSEPRTEDRAWCRHREVRGDDAKRRWECVRCGEPFAKAEARTRVLAELRERVEGLRPDFPEDRGADFAKGWIAAWDRVEAELEATE